MSDQADDSDGADHGEEQDDGDRAQYRPWNAAAVFQQRRATPVRRCRSGVMDRYTDIEHEHLDGDDDDEVEFRSQDEAGYSNGRDSDGVELRSEDEAEEDDDASFIDDSLVDDTSASPAGDTDPMAVDGALGRRRSGVIDRLEARDWRVDP